MNTKQIIITLSILGTIILLIISGFVIVGQFQIINPLSADTSQSTNNYIIESGLESIAPSVKSAVESYLLQDSSESNTGRKTRLSGYFSGDSPVYNHTLDLLIKPINKTSAKVTSIKSLESESSDLNLSVDVRVTSVVNDKTTSKNLVYWVSLRMIYNDTLIPYDIGEVKI